MHRVHPDGPGTRAKLPKALVGLLARDGAGRSALQRVLALAAPRAPRRVRTEAAIALANAGECAAPERVAGALVEAVLESEAELAVRAVDALGVLARGGPAGFVAADAAREGPCARAAAAALQALLERWDALGQESVRIALGQCAAEWPAHYRALQRVFEGASDDTVAGALVEAAAASARGAQVSLAALDWFEATLRGESPGATSGAGSAGAGVSGGGISGGGVSGGGVSGGGVSGGSVSKEGAPRARFAPLTAEQALVRREAVLLGFARAAEPPPDAVAARVFMRPLASASEDAAAAFEGTPRAPADFRFRGELAVGEALARHGLLAAQLAATPQWWDVDAGFLADLAQRAGGREPRAALALAQAALVAWNGRPEPRRAREARMARTDLLALALAAASACGPEAALDGAGAARALIAGLARGTIERGLEARDLRALDRWTFERLFSVDALQRDEDARARLEAAERQLRAQAALAAGDTAQAAALAAEARAGGWVSRSRAAEALQRQIEALLAAPGSAQSEVR
ncbi:MAG: hypothetical protein R3F49_12270 [Planctomycetota bacterium]